MGETRERKHMRARVRDDDREAGERWQRQRAIYGQRQTERENREGERDRATHIERLTERGRERGR
jgi:hypothetical protein